MSLEDSDIETAHRHYLNEVQRNLGWTANSWRLPKDRHGDIDMIEEWCDDEFGPHLSNKTKARDAVWMVVDLSGKNEAIYCFKTDAMAVAFRLRWT